MSTTASATTSARTAARPNGIGPITGRLFARQLAAQGVSCPHAAAHLSMVPRTLRDWRQALPTSGPGDVQPVGENGDWLGSGRSVPVTVFAVRGRPPKEVDLPTRNQVFRFLHHVTGPAVGLPALQDLFRTVPRCILADLSSRYRRVWQRRYARHGFELTWHQAGTVWAMDFTQPLEPIDGVFPYLLAIREQERARKSKKGQERGTGALIGGDRRAY
jgi:hypothetical protein